MTIRRDSGLSRRFRLPASIAPGCASTQSLPTDQTTVITSTDPPDRTIFWREGAIPRRGDRIDIDRLFTRDLVILDSVDPFLRRFLIDLPVHTYPDVKILVPMTYVVDFPGDDELESVLRCDALVGSQHELKLLMGQRRSGGCHRGDAGRMRVSNLRSVAVTLGADGAHCVRCGADLPRRTRSGRGRRHHRRRGCIRRSVRLSGSPAGWRFLMRWSWRIASLHYRCDRSAHRRVFRRSTRCSGFSVRVRLERPIELGPAQSRRFRFEARRSSVDLLARVAPQRPGRMATHQRLVVMCHRFSQDRNGSFIMRSFPMQSPRCAQVRVAWRATRQYLDRSRGTPRQSSGAATRAREQRSESMRARAPDRNSRCVALV